MANAEETPDKSILLQFAKFSKGFHVSDFDEFVQKYIGVEKLEFFGRLAYPNQWQMRLSDPKIREKLIRMGKTRINHRSCWMYPLNQQEIRGFVHWLPNSVTNDQLKEQLNLYGKVLLIESQERAIKGRKVESDLRYYCLMLPHGTTKEALPHFMKINGFLCHLAIRGRETACFHCKEVGHRRTECAKYKAKLISYCNRIPNTAQHRLKPRGRRHVKEKTQVEDQTGGDEVSSSPDILLAEGQVPVNAEKTEPQSLQILENRGNITEVQEEAINTEIDLSEPRVLTEQTPKSFIGTLVDIAHSEREVPADAQITEKQSFPVLKEQESITEVQGKATTSDIANELAETAIPTERTAKSCIGTSAASFSATESQGIVEILQKIQQRTAEDLRQRFQNFGNEIAQTLTSGKFAMNTTDQMQSTVPKTADASPNLEQKTCKEEPEKQTKETVFPRESFIPVKMPEDSKTDTKIKEREEDEITPTITTMHQVKEDIAETHENICKEMKEMEKEEQPTNFRDVWESIASILEQTKKAASETIQNTFKKLEEEVKSIEETEMPEIESDADTKQKLSKGEMWSELIMLEQAKQIASDYIGSTFKKLEEEVASLSIQMANELTITSTKVTKEDLDFAFQMLKQGKETIGGTLQNTFRNLAGMLEKETEPAEITTARSAESKPSSKIVESSTKSSATLKQLKQEALDIVKQYDKEGIKFGVAAENEQKSTPDKKQKDTNLSESDIGAVSQDYFEAAKNSESTKENEKEADSKTDFSASTRLEPHVAKVTLENIDELQKNIREVFISFLAKDELLPETIAILKQVESKVNEAVDKILNKQ